MGNLKTDEDDVFITSASPDTEPDEADAAFDAKEKKIKRSKIINRIILIICACVFVFAAFKLVSILLEYKKGNDIYDNIEGNILEDKPVNITIGDDNQDVTVPFVYNHQALLNINPDGLGFLYVPSVDIRLPIAQTTDNDFYLTHTFDKTYNGNGCLFVDYRITNKLKANHVLIYGHNMNSGAMFGSLSRYETPSFYQTEGNDVFYIYTEDVIRKYKIFTVYITDPISDTFTFNFSNLAGLREYAKNVQAQSLYNTGVDITNTTQIVTFSTCTNNSKQRLIVSGTYVGESKLDDGTSSESALSVSE
jgi:sortase, srtB family